MTRLFLLFSLLFFCDNMYAQTQKSLYAGVFANGGLSENAAAYFPFVNRYCEIGADATLMNENIGFSTGVTIANYGYLVGRHGEYGQQNLSYLKIPLGIRCLFSRKDARVQFDMYTGLSTHCLLTAQYAPSYTSRDEATRSKANFHTICLGGYAGCGMQVRLSSSVFVTIGAQSNIGIGDQNIDDVQGHTFSGGLNSFTLNLGAQYRVFSRKATAREEKQVRQ